ncbi:MAG: lipoyl(octanoyl) transferase LipB [Rhodothermales bacterium]|nr:lipoyl(octanoyl) transferase LipB [Rhodothermales bacterium]
MAEQVKVCRLGRLRYEPTWKLQAEIQARLIEAKRADPPRRIPHVLLLLEHDPVYTLGKSGDESNVVWDDDRRAREGVTLHRIDRGGDVTFHGPGQLVGYPILDLDRFFTDIHRYLRELEECVIRVLDRTGVEGDRFDGRTGVWIGPDQRGAERKVCAMGVRCSRWVTMHGFALNVQPRLSLYDGIIPCGIDDRGVTSMALETGAPIPMSRVMDWFVEAFADRFECETESLSGPMAWEWLSEFVGRPLDPGHYVVPEAPE